jgi:nucleotide-binding universal stress UspA family protein
MTVLVWITEDTWAASVDAARTLAPAGQPVALLHVLDSAAVAAARGAFGGLLGRAGPDPMARLEAMAESSVTELLDAAEDRLGRPAERIRLHGRPEHQVTGAARGATLLVVARQGTEAGPKSLGKAARFVVDHAPCPVLLIWPGPVPDDPPGPPHHRGSGPPHHPG